MRSIKNAITCRMIGRDADVLLQLETAKQIIRVAQQDVEQIQRSGTTCHLQCSQQKHKEVACRARRVERGVERIQPSAGLGNDSSTPLQTSSRTPPLLRTVASMS